MLTVPFYVNTRQIFAVQIQRIEDFEANGSIHEYKAWVEQGGATDPETVYFTHRYSDGAGRCLALAMVALEARGLMPKAPDLESMLTRDLLERLI